MPAQQSAARNSRPSGARGLEGNPFRDRQLDAATVGHGWAYRSEPSPNLPGTLASRGLQHVRLEFEELDGARQERLLYTLVRGPARVLVYGRAPWLSGLDPARFMRVDGDPAAPEDPGAFDLVVIDSLSPADFPSGHDGQLLVASSRTGFLLVNGPMRGVAEDPQVIGDWNRSALSPILPVDSDPREFTLAPPGRDIVILIDTSGSMDRSFRLAKSVAHAVIDQLRPQDTLAILPFSDSPGASFVRQPATSATVAHPSYAPLCAAMHPVTLLVLGRILGECHAESRAGTLCTGRAAAGASGSVAQIA